MTEIEFWNELERLAEVAAVETRRLKERLPAPPEPLMTDVMTALNQLEPEHLEALANVFEPARKLTALHSAALRLDPFTVGATFGQLFLYAGQEL